VIDGTDKLEIKSGGGLLVVFGLIFAGVGTVFLIGMLSIGKDGPPSLFLFLPVVFIIVGLCVAFGRAGVIFDKREGIITKWWGLGVRLGEKTRPLSEFGYSTISREVRRSKDSTYIVFPVRIEGAGGKLNIKELRKYEKAREQAEEIAKFIDFSVKDSSSGTVVEREAGTLDESLRERAARTGENREIKEPLPGCRIKHTVSSDKLVFEIPPLGRVKARIIFYFTVGSTILFLVIFLVFFIPMFKKSGNVPIVYIVVIPILIGNMAIGFVLSRLFRGKRTVIEVSLKILRVKTGSAKALEIPSDEIEELEIGNACQSLNTIFKRGTAIIARSDKLTISFGAGLRRKELQWLRDSIEYILIAS
jgi:hypothetical protein